MKVYFGQIYTVPGVSFPFSIHFQRRLSEEITALVANSAKFTQKYGDDWKLIFRINAKRGIDDIEIRGPAVFRKDKDVEYSIFLPFDVIQREAAVPQAAVNFLLGGVCAVFDSFGIDVSRVRGQQNLLVETICADPATFKIERS